jgi:hypothetical protein
VACTELPVVRLESGAVTLTEATGTGGAGATEREIVAGPTPSTVTPIVDAPTATAVIRPLGVTVAIPVTLLFQTTVRPVRGRMLLAASRATTVPCTVVPTVMLESGVVTLTEATATGATLSVKVAGPTPSTVTPIVVYPTPNAEMAPLVDTAATPGALLDQTTVRPTIGRMLFAASLAITVA